MKKRILLSLLLTMSLNLYANTKNNISNDELNKQLQAEALLKNEDTKDILGNNDNKKSKHTSSYEINKDKYEDIALINYIERYNKENDKLDFSINTEKKISFVNDNIGIYNKKIEEIKAIKKAEKEQQQKEINETRTVYLSGYCFTKNEIEVEHIQSYSLLDCEFEDNDLNIKQSKLMTMFVPITNRNALIGTPIYLLGKNNKKLPVETGVILTLDRTSMNIANFINDKKLKKISGDVLTQTGDIFLNQSMAYMNQLQESKKREEINSSASISGTTITKTTNTEAPDFSTYLVHSGIQLISGILKLGGILISEDKYPLFKVYQNSGFYADFIVVLNSEKNNTRTKENEQRELVDYQLKEYEKSNKHISIGDDVPEQKFQLPNINTQGR